MLALRSQRRVCGRGLARRGLCARTGRAEQFLQQRQQRIEDGDNDNPMVVRLSSSNSDLFLVGTHHDHPRSANIVRAIIERVKPHVTAIEQRGGTSYLKGVRADNDEFAVAAQLGSKHGGTIKAIDIVAWDCLAGVERTTPLVELVEACIVTKVNVICFQIFGFWHPRLKQTSSAREFLGGRDEAMAGALRPFVYSVPREGGTGRCVAVVGRAHVVGIVNKLLSDPEPIADPYTRMLTDNLDVRRSIFDMMYGGVFGGTLNHKDRPFGYVEKSEAATEFFKAALSGEAVVLAWIPLISADAINNETLRIVARRLLDAFQAGHHPLYTMHAASREVLELNASGAVSHSSSWLRRMFNLGPKLHIDHEVGLTSLAGAELDRLTEILSRQRRLAATKEVTLTNIVPRFEESECVELVPLELDAMDLSDAEQVSKWLYH